MIFEYIKKESTFNMIHPLILLKLKVIRGRISEKTQVGLYKSDDIQRYIGDILDRKYN